MLFSRAPLRMSIDRLGLWRDFGDKRGLCLQTWALTGHGGSVGELHVGCGCDLGRGAGVGAGAGMGRAGVRVCGMGRRASALGGSVHVCVCALMRV